MTDYISMNNKEGGEKECLICLDDVNTEKNHIKCYNCNKLFHVKCMNEWRDKKKLTYSPCVHCTKDDLIVHKFEQKCCIGCWNWIFPKKRKNEFYKIMIAYD